MSWSNDSRPLRDEEYPDPDPDEEHYETISCPECGATLFEDVDQCPACGAFVLVSTSPWRGRSLIWIGLGLLGVVATILTLLA